MTSLGETEPLFYYLSNKSVVLCLSFIGGFIDATGYVKLDGLFTSSITGNLVVGCAALFGSGVGVFARIFVTLLFATGAFFTTIASTKLRVVLKRNNWETGIVLFKSEILCLLIAMIFSLSVDYSYSGVPGLNSWQAIISGSLLALSMGVHNAAAQDLIPNCPSTTVMTMTIVKTSMFAGNAVQFWLAHKGYLQLYASHEKAINYDETVTKKYETNAAKFMESVQPLIVFVVGAIFGALLAVNITFWGLFVPLLILVGLVLSIQAAQRAHQSNLHAPVRDIEMESTTSPMTEKTVVETEKEVYPEEVVVVGKARC